MRRAMLLGFLLLFLGGLFFINWYVLSRAALFFGGAPTWLAWFTLGMTYLYFFASFLEQRFGTRVTSRLYTAAAVWLGAVWVLLPFLLAAELLLLIPAVRAAGLAAYSVAFFLGLWFVVYAYTNGNRFETRHYTIGHARANPVRIVHLSDLHIGPAHRRGYLARVVRAVNQAKPDLVCITGDLIDQPGKLTPELLTPLRQLRAPVYYTLGNHEHYVGVRTIKELIKHSPLQLLEDAVAIHDGITIIGLTDSEDRNKVSRALPPLARKAKNTFTLLLYHRPDGLAAAAEHGVDLMLSGHTHAGQLWPFSLFVRFRFRNISGFAKLRGTTLYTSPGTGTWGPPMRLGSRSVITVLDVVCASDH
ncbi:metallophosphoesterase [Candidatus Woesearchaeota archaeon]|nr:MAG: metallophosphoesterase [Candidatus Woesearchaeota archaeon]